MKRLHCIEVMANAGRSLKKDGKKKSGIKQRLNIKG